MEHVAVNDIIVVVQSFHQRHAVGTEAGITKRLVIW